MEAEEKAKELFEKCKSVIPLMSYQDWGGGGGADYNKQKEDAKKCALIAVDLLLEHNAEGTKPNGFWLQVRQEIEKL